MYNNMTDIHEDMVTLVDEDGKEHEFTVLDIVDVNDREYAILIPMENDTTDTESEEQEAVIFRIDEVDGEQALIIVEDDDEWDTVARAWEEMVDSVDYDDEEEN